MNSLGARLTGGILTVAGMILILVGLAGLLLPIVPGFLLLIPGVYLFRKGWKKESLRSRGGAIR